MNTTHAARIVSRALITWKFFIESRSVDEVVGKYHPVRGKLLGTVDTMQQGPRIGANEIRKYFEHFLANDSIQVAFPVINESNVSIITNKILECSDYYTFILSKDGNFRKVNAKFTFLFLVESEANVKILLHNSGFTPEFIQELS